MFDALPPSTTAVAGELLPASPSMPDMDDVLRDFTAQHPNLAWLAQMIATQRAQAAASAASVADAACDVRQDEVDALHAELDQALTRADRLQRMVRRLALELRSAQQRLGDLAAAFGACGLCWGEDAHCPGCRGRGKPGHFASGPDLRAGTPYSGAPYTDVFAQSQPTSAASRYSTPPEPMKGDEP